MTDREDRHARGPEREPVASEEVPPGDAPGTALWLLARGLWPVPISPPGDPRSPSPGKAPIGRGWGRQRPSAPSLRRLYARHPLAGVGVLLGPASGVVDLESDDPAASAAAIARVFPAGVPETIGWRSERGEHRLFRWDDRLGESARTAVVMLEGGAFELRLGGRGKQVASVCPPSIAAGGARRAWNGCWRIAPLPAELLSALCESACRRIDGRPH